MNEKHTTNTKMSRRRKQHKLRTNVQNTTKSKKIQKLPLHKKKTTHRRTPHTQLHATMHIQME